MDEMSTRSLTHLAALAHSFLLVVCCSSPPLYFGQAFNVINGGSHAGNKLAMQEFMVLPVGAESFK